MKSDGTGSWLCPTELDRSRVVDANARMRKILMVGVGTIGVAMFLTTPWIGWWTLIPFAFAAITLPIFEYQITRSARPERVSVAASLTMTAVLGVTVALSGGPRSPVLPWMVFPTSVIATRFRLQVVIASLILTVAAILLSTLAVDPAATVNNPVSVIATLVVLVWVVAVISAMLATELHHRDEAILDPLTGLLNRHALAPRFVELACQARITHQPVSLVMCDVDNFKEINDEHGHDTGDAVLRDIAYELRKRLRSFELIYRLGGEEFLILLPGIGWSDGQEIAERLRSAVESTHPAGIPITISLGLSSARGDDVDYDTLFKAADAALYEAKRTGRNRVVAAPAPAGEPDEPSPSPAEALLASHAG